MSKGNNAKNINHLRNTHYFGRYILSGAEKNTPGQIAWGHSFSIR
jgi:hypothetical protein